LPSGSTATQVGPIIDSNSVFDSVFVDDEPNAVTLTISRASTDTELKFPGNTFKSLFNLKFDALVPGFILAPYNIVLTKKATPGTADEWTWGTTCTNTKWGKESTGDPPLTWSTLVAPTPTCTASGHVLTIAMTENLEFVSDEFTAEFEIGVTNPINFIGEDGKVTATFTDSSGAVVYAVSDEKGAGFTVNKPVTDDTIVKGYAAWGADLENPKEI